MLEVRPVLYILNFEMFIFYNQFAAFIGKVITAAAWQSNTRY